jgi:exodeoxyribonuclease VIII
MADMAAYVRGEIKLSTPATKLGTAVHMRLLQPELFKVSYATKEQCSGITGKGARCSKCGQTRVDGLWFCDQHLPAASTPDPVTPLSESDAEKLPYMARAVFAHPAVSLIRQNGGCEVVILWTDDETGLSMKAKLDKWIPECLLPGDTVAVPTILDLKKCCDIDDDSIRKAISNYGYHRRASLYRDGIEALTGQKPDFVFVFILDAPPWHVRVVTLGDESLTGGRWEVRNCLNLWAQATKQNKYRGYPLDIECFDVPDYLLKKYREVML